MDKRRAVLTLGDLLEERSLRLELRAGPLTRPGPTVVEVPSP